MTGSKTNIMNRKEVLAAIQAISPSQDFVWDGNDDGDRPATSEELNAGMTALTRKHERLSSSETTQIALHVDNAVLEAFRATGRGWQTRMNNALKEWLSEHAA